MAKLYVFDASKTKGKTGIDYYDPTCSNIGLDLDAERKNIIF